MKNFINSIRKYFILGLLAIVSVAGVYSFMQNKKGETKVEAYSQNVIGFTVAVGNQELSTGYHTDTVHNFMTLSKYRAALYDMEHKSLQATGFNLVPWWAISLYADEATYTNTQPMLWFVVKGHTFKEELPTGAFNDNFNNMYNTSFMHNVKAFSVSTPELDNRYIFGDTFTIDTKTKTCYYGLNMNGEVMETSSRTIYNSFYNIKLDSNYNVTSATPKSISYYVSSSNLSNNSENKYFTYNGNKYDLNKSVTLPAKLDSRPTFAYASGSSYVANDDYLYYKGSKVEAGFNAFSCVTESVDYVTNHLNLGSITLTTSGDKLNAFTVRTNNENLRVYANGQDVTNKKVVIGTSLEYKILNKQASKEYSLSGNVATMPNHDLTVNLIVTNKKFTARWDKSISYTLTNGSKPQDFDFIYEQDYTLPELYRVGYRLTHYLINDVKQFAGEKLNTRQTNDIRIVPVFEKVTYQLTNIDNKVYSLVFDNATAQIGDTVTFTLTLKDKGYTLNSIVSNCIPNGSLNVNATSFVLTPADNNSELSIEVEYTNNVYNIYFSDNNRLSNEVITLNYLDKQLIEEKYQQARDILKAGYYLTNLKAYAYNNGVLGEEFDITEAFNMPSTDLIIVGEWALQNYKITLSLDKTVNYVDKDGKALTSSKFYKDALDALNITISNLDETLVINANIASEASLPTVKAPYRAFKGWYLQSKTNQFDNEGLTNLTYYYTIAEAIENNPDTLVFNLYPYFEVAKANISFMTDANTVFETVENYVNTPLATMSAPNEPHSEIGVFGGWYFDSKFENEFVVGESNTPEASEVKVYAKWLKNTYKVVFYNWNGDILSDEDVLTNQVPNYTGATPEREISQGKIYKFIGWDKEITKVTENVSYTAQFSYELIDYVVSVYDGNDGLVLSSTYHFGDELVLPKTATKTSTAQFDYEFAGWDNKSNYVYSNMDIRATFKEILRSYDITWNVNGKEIVISYNYGVTPDFTGNTEKAGNERYNYEFAGWTPEVEVVTENATYTALYNQVDKVYSVTFYNVYGEEIETVEYKYGEKVETPTEYTSFSLKETVKFAGWVDENNDPIGNYLSVSQSLRAFPTFTDENNNLIENDPLNLASTTEIRVVAEEIAPMSDIDLNEISTLDSSFRYYQISRYVGDRRITDSTDGANVTISISKDKIGSYRIYSVDDNGNITELKSESITADGINFNMASLGKIIVRYDNIPTISLAQAITGLSITSAVLAGLCVIVFVKTRRKNTKIARAGKED